MRKPFSILNEQAANFSPVKARLESEFSMIDWRYDMIDFAAPWDKQSILCLTNSRCYLLKETTYIEVKYLLEGLSKVLCYGIPYTLLRWVAHYSLRITIFLYWSVQANRSIWGGHLQWLGLSILDPIHCNIPPEASPTVKSSVHLLPWPVSCFLPSPFFCLCLCASSVCFLVSYSQALIHPSEINSKQH